jgi:protein-disulfide isomerase
MKYFWHFVISIAVLALILFAFFGASLRFGNNIHYTDQANVTEPSITFVDPTLGPANAKATVVVYGDYGCDACAALDKTLVMLAADTFPNDLRIVWKDMPNTSQHPEALNAAVAARCAGDQGQFWQYHTLLMNNHTTLGLDLYTTLAADLKLNASPFSSCLAQQTPAPIIQQSYEEGLALGISATPTVYFNGVRYTGALDEGTLKAMIRQAIATK